MLLAILITYDQITMVNVPETVSPLSRSAMGYLTTVLDSLKSSRKGELFDLFWKKVCKYV